MGIYVGKRFLNWNMCIFNYPRSEERKLIDSSLQTTDYRPCTAVSGRGRPSGLARFALNAMLVVLPLRFVYLTAIGALLNVFMTRIQLRIHQCLPSPIC